MATAIAVPRYSFRNRSPAMLGDSVSAVMTKPFRNRKAASIEILELSAAVTEQRIVIYRHAPIQL